MQPVPRIQRLRRLCVGCQHRVIGFQYLRQVQPGQHSGDLESVQGEPLRRELLDSRVFEKVDARRGRDPAQSRTNLDVGCRTRCFDQAHRDAVGGVDVPTATACQRVARRLQRAELHRPCGLDLQQRSPRRQTTCGAGVLGDCLRRPGELRTAGRDRGLTPVTVTGDHRVLEGVRPVLQLKVGPVGCGAPWRIDPGARRPTGARAHQRHVQRAVGIDGESGYSAVEHRDRARVERLQPGGRILVDDDLEVGEILDKRVHGGGELRSGDDEHR